MSLSDEWLLQQHTPSNSEEFKLSKYFTFSKGKALVNTLVTMSSVGIRYSSHQKTKSIKLAQKCVKYRTLYNELGDVNLLEQPWLQLMCCTICLLYSCKFS